MQEFKKFLEILRNDDPKYLAESLLLELVDYCDAQSGCVYILSFLDNSFIKRFSYSADHMPERVKIETVEANPFLFKTIIQIETYSNDENLFVPIFKISNNKKYCLGYLHFQHQRIIDQQRINFIEDVAVMFNQIFRNLFVNNLLKKANHPIGFKQSRDQYYKNLISLISSATQLPLIALMEYDENNEILYGTGSLGFDDGGVDITIGNIPDIFRESITKIKSLQCTWGNNSTNFLQVKGVANFQLALLPVLQDRSLWGILILATKCEYFFSNSELQGLEMVAHRVGGDINNYHNFHYSNSKLFELANKATLITGIEIAQSVRHEAKNILNESQTKLILLDKTIDKIQKSKLINELSNKLVDVHNSLDKIRLATKPPERVLSIVNLKTIWEDSLEMVHGKLTEHNIRIKTIGNLNINFNGYQDWLRHAFLNLLLNSLDAYKGRSKKSREITLSLDMQSESNRKISMIYMDNAGGIEVQNLVVPELVSAELKNDLNQLIFQPNVTSKEDGSGYGLYLTRLTFQVYHQGTIELINNRGGTSFSIEIPLNLE